MSDEVEMTPVADIPPVVTPFAKPAAAPAVSAPASAPAAPAASGGTTVRLRPVIRKPMIRKPSTLSAAPASAAASSPVSATEAAKKSTANLKSITAPIPAQAVLKKTGIVAEGIITPAQAQAAKSKTSRISLESAMGVAPAKEAPAPLKTIRLRRPTDLRAPHASAPAAATSETATEIKSAPVMGTEASSTETVDTSATTVATTTSADASITQKKTLKLHRPGVSVKRPSLDMGAATQAGADATVADVPELAPVADLGDVPELAPLTAEDEAPAPKTTAGLPTWLVAITSTLAVAAVLVIGLLTYKLHDECTDARGFENGVIQAPTL